MDILEKFLHSIAYKFPKGYPDLNNEQDIFLLESLLKKQLGEEIELINEVNLSPTQLEKPYPSKSDFATVYKDRGERFLKKIEDGEEFELSNGTTVKIDKDGSKEAIDFLKSKNYKELGGVKKLFKDTEGNSYSLSNFKKTKEFGSGSGQGAGAAATATAESSQCVFTSLAYTVKNSEITEEDITDENLDKAYSRCNVTDSLESIKAFSQDKSWLNTFILSANALYNQFANPNFEFHRGSKFVQSIYDAYKKASKNEGISMQSDKWNPADIWLVDKSILDTTFPINLQELNALLLDLFNDNKLIGVSLKKLGKSASLSLGNASESEVKKVTIESIEAKPTNKGSQINYNDGKIYFRTFNFATNFAGEILGKTAAHGKIGEGPLRDILKQNNLPPLENSKVVKANLESKNENTINEFYENFITVSESIEKNQFLELIESKDIDWQVSKYMALHISAVIKRASNDVASETLSDMVGYASSSTKLSSIFVKIS
jgi:hypothetical protein